MRFKPGDLAEVLPHDGNIPGGEIVTIISYEGVYDNGLKRCENCWNVNWNGDKEWVVNDRVLKPLYDGNEKTSWEDCVWQPKELVV